MNLQPVLIGTLIQLHPLHETDFEALYAVASDPLIWDQHPCPDRYLRTVFEQFFKEAMASGGAFKILDDQTKEIIGCTRFYELKLAQNEVAIGYTFIAKNYWGGMYNRELKTLMVDYAFQFLNRVIFYVGVENFRSQRAMEKIGGKRETSGITRTYQNGDRVQSFVYVISS